MDTNHTGLLLRDRFRLIEKIGSGGFGSVYCATDEVMRNEVAVKILHRSLFGDDTQVRRFELEARAAFGLRHPNTIRVFDLGRTPGGAPYMVMELLKGSALSGVLRREGRFTPARAARIVEQVFGSLAEAHACGIVHRDLKPDNIFLTEVIGVPDLVKVMDFGIAKSVGAVTQSLTATGTIIGSPRYMSPEQSRGRPVDARSDLYSMGVVLYQLLAGVPPFVADTPVSLLLMHCEEPVPKPDERAGTALSLPAGIESVMYRLLEKDPAKRFQTALEATDALRAISGELVARPTTRPTAPATDLLALPAEVELAAELTGPALETALLKTVAMRPEPISGTLLPSTAELKRAAVAPEDEPVSGASAATPAAGPEPSAERQPPRARSHAMSAIVGAACVLGILGFVELYKLTGPDPDPSPAAQERASPPSAPATSPGEATAVSPAPSEPAAAAASHGSAELGAAVPVPAAETAGTIPAEEPVLPKPQVEVPPGREKAPPSVDRLAELARSGAAADALVAAAAGLVPLLAPEQQWDPARVEVVRPGSSAKVLSGLCSVSDRPTLVLFTRGRYLLDDTLVTGGAVRVAMVAEPGTELFAASGQAVLLVKDSRDVLVHGLYMNHYSEAVEGWKHGRWLDCSAEGYVPRIKDSTVLEVTGSSRVSVGRSELMGSGFIGLLAKSSTGLRLYDTVVHDCISSAIRLESSDLEAADLLVYDVANRVYKKQCRGEGCSANWLGAAERAWLYQPIRFVTGVYVSPGSRLTASHSTFVNSAPAKGAQMFEVGGRLDLRESLIVHSTPIGLVKKSTPEIALRDVCLTAASLPAAAKRSGEVRLGEAVTFPGPATGESFVHRPDTRPSCAGYGARLTTAVVPEHEKPQVPAKKGTGK